LIVLVPLSSAQSILDGHVIENRVRNQHSENWLCLHKGYVRPKTDWEICFGKSEIYEHVTDAIIGRDHSLKVFDVPRQGKVCWAADEQAPVGVSLCQDTERDLDKAGLWKRREVWGCRATQAVRRLLIEFVWKPREMYGVVHRIPLVAVSRPDDDASIPR